MGGSPRIVMSPLHPRRGARDDGSLGPPNSAEQELHKVCRQIAELAPQKFTTVREAFRYLRPDHNGSVSRSQVQYFFRAYGVQREQADRLFAYFEPNESDDIDCQKFIEFFRQQINPEEDAGAQGEGDAASVCPPTPGSSAGGWNAAPTDRLGAKLAKDFHYMLEEVKDKAPQKFSHVREALRIVDVDYDGCITRSEMQHFFRAFGIDEMRSDSMFEKMAKGGPGGANYYLFVQVVGPFLDLPGVAAVIQSAKSRQESQRPRSARPQSARNRLPSADRRPSSRPASRAVSPADEDRKSVLESALSGAGSACLPALGRPAPEVMLIGHGTRDEVLETPLSTRGSKAAASPLPAFERPSTPTSARGSRKGSRERSSSVRAHACPQLSARKSPNETGEIASSVCNSPRPASVRSNAEPQDSLLSARERPDPPGHTGRPQVQATPRSHKYEQGEQVLQGNFKPQQGPSRPGDVFKPAPPPAVARQGRRPMGIQRDAQAAEKQAQVEQYPPEMATALKEALTSGDRPVATPSRRPSSGYRNRAQGEA